MNFSTFALTIFASTFLSLPASAKAPSFSTKLLATPADSSLETVLRTNRLLPDHLTITTTELEMSSLPESLAKDLAVKASELAMIWGDTILEGDYWASEKTSLEQVEEVQTSAGQVLGYRITYAAQAWDISACDFNPEQLETLKACHEGRIVETGFISIDMKHAIQDEPAEFVD